MRAVHAVSAVLVASLALMPPVVSQETNEDEKPKAHWAFRQLTRPKLPAVRQSSWPTNAIDYFVLQELEKRQLGPSNASSPHTLARRVAFDVTGLPPSPDVLEPFLSDPSLQSFELYVDKLLASPHFGERMAERWLDASRYADTSGYQNDGPRSMWRWRDWVIDAYNGNMSFKQFTIEQLAGDMLPNATRPQRIATGFNRNHRGNSEGGVIPEEFAVEYVVDRVDTTATVWLGLTLGCARCHDHKFDPLSQREFYQFYSFFNNVPEHGRAIKEGNSPPIIAAPTLRQEQRQDHLDQLARTARARVLAIEPDLKRSLIKWEEGRAKGPVPDWTPTEHLVVRWDAEPADPDNKQSGPFYTLHGPTGKAAQFDGTQGIDLGDVGKFEYRDKFTLSGWIETNHDGVIMSRASDVHRGDGYWVELRDGHIHVNLVKRWLDDSIRVATKNSFDFSSWKHIAVTYDGSRRARGIAIYVDGQELEIDVKLDFINQSFSSDEPFRIASGAGPKNRFRGAIAGVRLYATNLSPQAVSVLATRESIEEILGLSRPDRTGAQVEKLRQWFLEHDASESIKNAHAIVKKIDQERAKLIESISTVMVMQESKIPKQAHILLRGEYDKPGEPVEPGVPAALFNSSRRTPSNRLELARWLVDPSNPLTARVTVNRYWQLFFGNGLVKTLEDFGSQGERPSHPNLLDWLASEFVASGWDIKHVLKTIVMSSTYRQSSHTSERHRKLDPDNRLLARGTRLRLSAAEIRDQSLAISGLLARQIGGPSVRPYQPTGLWKEIASVGTYEQSHGEDLYRRSLYVYWKRTVTPPTMSVFDASSRETCRLQTPATNTPLQALTLLNETSFVESARVLAQNVLSESERTPVEYLQAMFRAATCRPATNRELTVLQAALTRHKETFSDDQKAASELISVGEFPIDNSLRPSELAAYTAIANTLLNLDELIMKE